MGYMTTDEIARSYRQAHNKTEQVLILSELTASDPDTVIEILKDTGELHPGDIKYRICCRCGGEYITPNRKGNPVCPECKYVNRQIADLESRIKVNNAKIHDLNLQIGEIVLKSRKLRARINSLKKGAINER